MKNVFIFFYSLKRSVFENDISKYNSWIDFYQ